MYQEHLVNDLYAAVMKDDKLSLLWEINQVNKLAVNTPQGLSQRKGGNTIVCQGDRWVTTERSLHMDDIGKES